MPHLGSQNGSKMPVCPWLGAPPSTSKSASCSCALAACCPQTPRRAVQREHQPHDRLGFGVGWYGRTPSFWSVCPPISSTLSFVLQDLWPVQYVVEKCNESSRARVGYVCMPYAICLFDAHLDFAYCVLLPLYAVRSASFGGVVLCGRPIAPPLPSL